MSKIIILMLLLFSFFLPVHVPGYISVIALCFIVGILTVRVVAKDYINLCLRAVIYLTVPVVLYLIREESATWINTQLLYLFHFSFGIVAIFAFMTAKFTQRQKGFRVTTMDFLVIFIAVIVPYLLDQSIQVYGMGLLAVEIIALLFSIEILTSEFRERIEPLTFFTLGTLALIGIRGVMGF